MCGGSGTGALLCAWLPVAEGRGLPHVAGGLARPSELPAAPVRLKIRVKTGCVTLAVLNGRLGTGRGGSTGGWVI